MTGTEARTDPAKVRPQKVSSWVVRADDDLQHLDVGILDDDQRPVEEVPDELELEQGDGHQTRDGQRHDDRRAGCEK